MIGPVEILTSTFILIISIFIMLVALPAELILENLKYKKTTKSGAINYYRGLLLSLRQSQNENISFHLVVAIAMTLVGFTYFEKNITLQLSLISMMAIILALKKIMTDKIYLNSGKIENQIISTMLLMISIVLILNANMITLTVPLINIWVLKIINIDKSSNHLEIKKNNIFADKTFFYSIVLTQVVCVVSQLEQEWGILQIGCISSVIFLVEVYLIEFIALNPITNRNLNRQMVTPFKKISIVVSLFILYKCWAS